MLSNPARQKWEQSISADTNNFRAPRSGKNLLSKLFTMLSFAGRQNNLDVYNELFINLEKHTYMITCRMPLSQQFRSEVSNMQCEYYCEVVITPI